MTCQKCYLYLSDRYQEKVTKVNLPYTLVRRSAQSTEADVPSSTYTHAVLSVLHAGLQQLKSLKYSSPIGCKQVISVQLQSRQTRNNNCSERCKLHKRFKTRISLWYPRLERWALAPIGFSARQRLNGIESVAVYCEGPRHLYCVLTYLKNGTFDSIVSGKRGKKLSYWEMTPLRFL